MSWCCNSSIYNSQMIRGIIKLVRTSGFYKQPLNVASKREPIASDQNEASWWRRPISALSAESMDTQHRVLGFLAVSRCSVLQQRKPPLRRLNIYNTAGITLLPTTVERRSPVSTDSAEKSSEKSVVWGRVVFLFGECFCVYTGQAALGNQSTRLCLGEGLLIDCRILSKRRQVWTSISTVT